MDMVLFNALCIMGIVVGIMSMVLVVWVIYTEVAFRQRMAVQKEELRRDVALRRLQLGISFSREWKGIQSIKHIQGIDHLF